MLSLAFVCDIYLSNWL